MNRIFARRVYGAPYPIGISEWTVHENGVFWAFTQQAHLARDSLVVAEKEVARVFDEVARWQKHPALGRAGRVPDTRELVIPPYIVA